MTSQILTLVASYFLCSAAAEDQVLPKHKIDECNAIYTQLKLSFTDIGSVDEFMALMKEDRARINQQGYSGYLTWLEENPELVASLRDEARANRFRFNF